MGVTKVLPVNLQRLSQPPPHPPEHKAIGEIPVLIKVDVPVRSDRAGYHRPSFETTLSLWI